MNKIMILLTRLRRLQRIMLNWQNVIHGVLCPVAVAARFFLSSFFFNGFLCRL